MTIANGDGYASVVLEYVRVVEDITGRINRGELKRGEKLAAETDLAECYGVSVTTIRRAMEELRKQGLIESVWGRGTFVIERKRDA
jgi:GntR family transcriptional regulator